jgi:c(7)-type cytochrome triheme protein
MKSCLPMFFRTGLTMLISLFLFAPADDVAAAAKSHQYGDVEMGQFSKDNQVRPVTFRHWTHRDKYTCRLCHVDIEFSQIPGETGVLEEDNRDGRYCGVCHNGKDTFAVKECSKCHPKDKNHQKESIRQAKKSFFKFRKTMPPSMYGNKIDWMKAESEGKINPIDSLPGVSFDQGTMVINRRDEPRTPKLPGLPDIIFSHSKHVVWNGCGMCHPESFAIETGKTEMTMKEIIAGKFCGRCHGTVAFPINDCSRCHSKQVSLK